MSDNYAEETKPLFKMLRTEAFRFVIVRYNHFSFLKQLEEDLKHRFPDRPFLKVDAQKADYQSLTQTYFSISRGFLFVENFDDVLIEQADHQNKETAQYKTDNERRRGITAGLNLRRDKLAKLPIALFVFVPASTSTLYAKIIMEKMPDLWSFRSLILDLERERSIPHDLTTADTHLKTEILKEDPAELNRLLALLDNTPESETAYRLTLYPQIATEAKNTGQYELAFSILDTWENQAADSEKVWIRIQKGDILQIYGRLEEALASYEEAKDLAEQFDDKNGLAISYEKLGDTHAELGNLEKALKFHQDETQLFEQLYESDPSNVNFKNNLAISYEKLGKTHAELGNLEKALKFYQDETQLFEQLYESYPSNVSFKNNLAISYEKLGETHAELGNLEKALKFYQDETQLFEQLYESYPSNVSFKNNLAISYEKLGETHAELGNLEKALKFYQDYNQLEKQLYESYPSNVSFKNGLA
ncbi:MAG TPA: tetratricopeptide repeat protein, partial [Rhodothermales bacterium]|nr:tetratricopeptide repeat protein [Rhodothermales bacterium]